MLLGNQSFLLPPSKNPKFQRMKSVKCVITEKSTHHGAKKRDPTE